MTDRVTSNSGGAGNFGYVDIFKDIFTRSLTTAANTYGGAADSPSTSAATYGNPVIPIATGGNQWTDNDGNSIMASADGKTLTCTDSNGASLAITNNGDGTVTIIGSGNAHRIEAIPPGLIPGSPSYTPAPVVDNAYGGKSWTDRQGITLSMSADGRLTCGSNGVGLPITNNGDGTVTITTAGAGWDIIEEVPPELLGTPAPPTGTPVAPPTVSVPASTSSTTTYPDGHTVTQSYDGEKLVQTVTTFDDGDTITVTPTAEGTTVEASSGGTVKPNDDGTFTVTFADGHVYTSDASGTFSLDHLPPGAVYLATAGSGESGNGTTTTQWSNQYYWSDSSKTTLLEYRVTTAADGTQQYKFLGSSLLQAKVDGVLSASDDPEEMSFDAQAETVFSLGSNLLNVSSGVVPTDWGREEYVAFAFGEAGLSNLVGTDAWNKFVAANLSGTDPSLDPQTMDFSMFDTFFPDGASGLGTIVGDGLALYDVFTTMQTQGITTFSQETFTDIFNTLNQSGRGLALRYRGSDPMPSPSQINTAQKEAGALVKYGSKASTAAQAGGAAGGVGAEGAAAGGVGVVGAAAVGAAVILTIADIGLIIDLVFKPWGESLQKNLDGAGDITDKGSEVPNYTDKGSEVPTYRGKGQLYYRTESTFETYKKSGAAAAADYLLEQEAQGVSLEQLAETLSRLPADMRSSILQNIRERVGGTDYYSALQDGRPYSALEDLACGTPSTPSALDSFLRVDPGLAQDPNTPVGLAYARRLEFLPVNTAKAMLSQWVDRLAADPTAGGGGGELSVTLETLKNEAPDLFASLVSGLYTESKDKFMSVIDMITMTGADGSSMAAAMIEVLPVSVQASVFAKLYSAVSMGQLSSDLAKAQQTSSNSFGYVDFASDAKSIYASMSVDAKAELSTYVDGSLLASSNSTAFLALTTNEERSAYLANLTPPPHLLEGDTPEAAKAMAQALLLSQLSIDDQAAIIVDDISSSDNPTPDYMGNAAAETDLFNQLLNVTDPGKGGELISAVTKGISASQELKNEAKDLIDNWLNPVVSDHLSLGVAADDATMLADIDAGVAASILGSMSREDAARALQAMIDNGDVTQAAAIVAALAAMSPGITAEILSRMSFEGAAKVLAALDPAVAKAILDTMPDTIAAAILSKMQPTAAVNIFKQTKGDDDYARMTGILAMMTTGPAADAVAEAGAGAPAGEPAAADGAAAAGGVATLPPAAGANDTLPPAAGGVATMPPAAGANDTTNILPGGTVGDNEPYYDQPAAITVNGQTLYGNALHLNGNNYFAVPVFGIGRSGAVFDGSIQSLSIANIDGKEFIVVVDPTTGQVVPGYYVIYDTTTGQYIAIPIRNSSPNLLGSNGMTARLRLGRAGDTPEAFRDADRAAAANLLAMPADQAAQKLNDMPAKEAAQTLNDMIENGAVYEATELFGNLVQIAPAQANQIFTTLAQNSPTTAAGLLASLAQTAPTVGANLLGSLAPEIAINLLNNMFNNLKYSEISTLLEVIGTENEPLLNAIINHFATSNPNGLSASLGLLMRNAPGVVTNIFIGLANNNENLATQLFLSMANETPLAAAQLLISLVEHNPGLANNFFTAVAHQTDTDSVNLFIMGLVQTNAGIAANLFSVLMTEPNFANGVFTNLFDNSVSGAAAGQLFSALIQNNPNFALDLFYNLNAATQIASLTFLATNFADAAAQFLILMNQIPNNQTYIDDFLDSFVQNSPEAAVTLFIALVQNNPTAASTFFRSLHGREGGATSLFVKIALVNPNAAAQLLTGEMPGNAATFLIKLRRIYPETASAVFNAITQASPEAANLLFTNMARSNAEAAALLIADLAQYEPETLTQMVTNDASDASTTSIILAVLYISGNNDLANQIVTNLAQDEPETLTQMVTSPDAYPSDAAVILAALYTSGNNDLANQIVTNLAQTEPEWLTEMVTHAPYVSAAAGVLAAINNSGNNDLANQIVTNLAQTAPETLTQIIAELVQIAPALANQIVADLVQTAPERLTQMVTSPTTDPSAAAVVLVAIYNSGNTALVNRIFARLVQNPPSHLAQIIANLVQTAPALANQIVARLVQTAPETLAQMVTSPTADPSDAACVLVALFNSGNTNLAADIVTELVQNAPAQATTILAALTNISPETVTRIADDLIAGSPATLSYLLQSGAFDGSLEVTDYITALLVKYSNDQPSQGNGGGGGGYTMPGQGSP